MQIALISHNAQAGDAIGNQLAEKLAYFLDRAAEARVFLESTLRLHPAIRPYCHTLARPIPQPDAWRYLTSCDLILFEYGQYYPTLELLPLLVGGKPRLVLDYHGITPPAFWGTHNREAILKGGQQRGVVWCCDAAVVHSRFTAGELHEATGFPTERTLPLGHCVDTDQFAPGAPSQSLRKKLDVEQTALILFVGRLAPNKRLPVLVEAVAQLHARKPEVHALIIGDRRDAYQQEADRCVDLAQRLGVADRLHFLGHADERTLRDAYRSADVFVMPSEHEGFCIPVAEAMACGLPVIAARAAALPETIGDAGLTFTPGDSVDLARQIERVLDAAESESATKKPFRVAVVAPRFGTNFVGGAETSLRTIANALHGAGHSVEVYTCCNTERREIVEGIVVHRFAAEPIDTALAQVADRAIEENLGQVDTKLQHAYLQNSVRSRALLECLQQRSSDIDAIIAGPYLAGLTCEVAKALAAKTILLPCFHDEAAARLSVLRQVYEQVGAIAYHSPEEQELAQTTLGISHPGAFCLGTLLDESVRGDPDCGRRRVGEGKRYLVYCGRYAPRKNLPLLIEYARRYSAERPGRFAVVFIGEGAVPVPNELWAIDLGFVAAEVRSDLIAGADALVQLSQNESLSLVALEAWANGVPVLAHARCAVLSGHLNRCQGGASIEGYETFAAALDDLWTHPERWQQRGEQGRSYVRARYGSRSLFVSTLESVISYLRRPLRERMAQRGPDRVRNHFARPAWQEQFGRLVDGILHQPARPLHMCVEVQLCSDRRNASIGQEQILVPVRIANTGTHAVLHEGPGRSVIRFAIANGVGDASASSSAGVALPETLLPGRCVAAAVAVPVPPVPGTYRIDFWIEQLAQPAGSPPADTTHVNNPKATLEVLVEPQGNGHASFCKPMRDAAEKALVQAGQLQRLPDDYADVTEGTLAGWKRRLKQKLLHNFKHAYVDVLSRQQSRFNEKVLAALHELAEYCATIEQALEAGEHLRSRERGADAMLDELRSQLAESERRCARLEKRLELLESVVLERQEVLDS